MWLPDKNITRLDSHAAFCKMTLLGIKVNSSGSCVGKEFCEEASSSDRFRPELWIFCKETSARQTHFTAYRAGSVSKKETAGFSITIT